MAKPRARRQASAIFGQCPHTSLRWLGLCGDVHDETVVAHQGQQRLPGAPDGHSARHLRDALIAAFSQLPEHARRTLTWDQGSEMARHHELAPYFDNGVYFARPAGPWQRGTNENTNGLIRQYLPKRTNLSLPHRGRPPSHRDPTQQPTP
ncbi:IS30 family transposase [Streptomyces sp. NPDC000880]